MPAEDQHTKTTCPPWCTDHHTRTADYAGQELRLEAHSGDAYSVWPRHGEDWLFWLRLSRVDITPGRLAPSIVLAERGSVCDGRSITPSDARGLAEALMRCAEIVEAEQTASCAGCGAPVEPVDADGCLECRQARPRLQLVETEGQR